MMDNYDLREQYDNEREQPYLTNDESPRCSECDSHIKEKRAFYINDEWICTSCMKQYYRRTKAGL